MYKNQIRKCGILISLLILLFSTLPGCNSSVPPESSGNRPAEENAGTAQSNTLQQINPKSDKDPASNQQTEMPSASKAPGKKKIITIALVPKSLDNSIYLDAKEESERVAKELGIRVEWLGPMHPDPDEQVALVESLIRRKVDGIIISCLDAGKMKPVINRAVKAGIKVATFDSDSPDSDRLFYCGTDNSALGAACGKALIRVLKEKSKLDSKLKLLVMTADEDSYNLNQRLDSFLETAREGGVKLDVIDTLYCREDINLAGEMLEIYFKTAKNTDVFFSTGGWPLMAPLEAMPSFQKWCRNGGASIVTDTYYPIVSAAKFGLADALVGQNFKKMGELSTRSLYKAIKGEQITEKFIDTGLEYGNKSNFDVLLQNKEPWETE